MLNNTNKIKDIVEFNKGFSYYKFVTLLRAKDYDGNKTPLVGKDKRETMIKHWLVESQEDLDKLLPDMLTIVKLFKCRLYMTTDRKSTVKTMVNIRNKMMDCLDQTLCHSNIQISSKMLNKVVHSMTSMDESSDRECRRWMFDVDTKDEETLKKVEKMCGEHYLTTLETKNGYHVVANKKFDAIRMLKELNVENVEVKSNALVLLAMENSDAME